MYIADGTHEARVVLVLRGARVTLQDQHVSLLKFANSARWRLCYPC